MSALMVTFLTHLDVPNASTLVFKNLQKGTEVVQGLMLEQLHDAENDMHILKASQISVNSAVRRRSPLPLGHRMPTAFNAHPSIFVFIILLYDVISPCHRQ